MRINANISSSLEDYLEAIADLIDANGHAHSKELAERLQVKMPSVTNALQALAARDLIEYRSHQPVVLTAAGAQAATLMAMRSAYDNAKESSAGLETVISRKRQSEVTASVIETASDNNSMNHPQ